MRKLLKLYEDNQVIISSDFAASLDAKKAFENSDSLVKLSRDRGKDFTTSLVTKILNDSVMFVKNSLSIQMIAAYAQKFISDHPNLKIDEFILILRRGTNGEYGKNFGDFDYTILNKWRGEYESSERADYFEQKNQKSTFGTTERQSKQGESLGDIFKNKMNDGFKKE